MNILAYRLQDLPASVDAADAMLAYLVAAEDPASTPGHCVELLRLQPVIQQQGQGPAKGHLSSAQLMQFIKQAL